MFMKRHTIILILTIVVTACGKPYRVKSKADLTPLADSSGYLGIVFNTEEPLANIKLLNTETRDEFYVGGTKKGISILLIELQESEYCLVGFDMNDMRMDYKDRSFCTYLDPDDVNYFGEIYIHNRLTIQATVYERFVQLMADKHPKICEEYIGKGC